MAGVERRAEATWEGNLVHGHGSVTGASGALGNMPVTWAARTESSDGKTSPEELIAAAQAACFAMAFSSDLTKAGHAPERLDVNTTCTFDRKPEGGWKIGSMLIEVHGRVPGIEAAEYEQVAQGTSQNCPVSGALRGNVEIRVQAHLDQ